MSWIVQKSWEGSLRYISKFCPLDWYIACLGACRPRLKTWLKEGLYVFKTLVALRSSDASMFHRMWHLFDWISFTCRNLIFSMGLWIFIAQQVSVVYSEYDTSKFTCANYFQLMPLLIVFRFLILASISSFSKFVIERLGISNEANVKGRPG